MKDFLTISDFDNQKGQYSNTKSLNEQMSVFTSEKQTFNQYFTSLPHRTKHQPLHQFSANDIANHIKYWILNDINYEKNLKETMNAFINNSVSGKIMQFTKTNHIKQILKSELSHFSTKQNISIMFNYLDQYKEEQQNDINTKTSTQIAYALYTHPLNALINQIKTDDINGTEFIRLFRTDAKFIHKITGWKKDDIYQIENALFKHISMNKRKS